MVAASLPICLPSAIGDRPNPGGGTWACLELPGAQCGAACGPNRALLFRKPRLAPASKVLSNTDSHIKWLSPLCCIICFMSERDWHISDKENF